MLDLVQMLARQLMIAYGFQMGLSGEVVEALAGAVTVAVAIGWAVKKNGHWDKFKAWLSKRNMV